MHIGFCTHNYGNAKKSLSYNGKSFDQWHPSHAVLSTNGDRIYTANHEDYGTSHVPAIKTVWNSLP